MRPDTRKHLNPRNHATQKTSCIQRGVHTRTAAEVGIRSMVSMSQGLAVVLARPKKEQPELGTRAYFLLLLGWPQ